MTTLEHKKQVLAHQEQQAAGSNRPALITQDQLARDYEHLVAAADEFTARAATAVPPVVEDDDDLALITSYVKDVRAERKRVSEIGDGEKRPYLDAHKTLHGWFNQLWQRLGELQDAVEARGDVYLEKKRQAERKRREAIEAKARAEAEAARQAALEAARVAAEKEAAAATPEVPLLAKQEQQETKAAAATALDTFAQANMRAEEASRAAAAKPAELARTKTDAGTATLQQEINFTYDITKLDLDAIRPFLRADEVTACIRAIARKNKDQILAGTFKVAGVTFTVGTKGQYR